MSRQTLHQVITQLWISFPNETAKLPMNWITLLDRVNILMEDQNLTNHSDYEELKKNFLKVINNWQVEFKNWSILASIHHRLPWSIIHLYRRRRPHPLCP
ncbi:hypothetical protein PUN28_008281 [Cardiocondyla obscurior]|uniref:Uncharacterized protein n=1 Tax=Cardiocondyla obscurior TaxID=286306 RepID=A0AAW2FZ01_9HYME